MGSALRKEQPLSIVDSVSPPVENGSEDPPSPSEIVQETKHPVQGTNESAQNSCWSHECFIAVSGFEPEGSLADRACTKHPGHPKFIGIKDLTKTDLPSDWMPDEMMDLVQAYSRLTVRIRGKYVSPDRPDNLVLGGTKPGQSVTMFGTGCIMGKPERLSRCMCGACPPGTAGYKIPVKTAAHVVCDSLEARRAVVELYADDPDDTSSIVTLPGWRIYRSNVEADWCEFYCVTHDDVTYRDLVKAWEKVHQVYKPIEKASGDETPPYHFIISHPHGFPQQISFGDRFKYTSGSGSFYYYNIPTCPGSSGAPIITHGFLGFFQYGHLAHHGIDTAHNGFNRTGPFKGITREFTV